MENDKNSIIIKPSGSVMIDFQNISQTPSALSIQLSNAIETAEELARRDDFSSLKIDEDSYRKAPKATYGIEYDKFIHTTGKVILPRQKKAAELFLRDLRGFGLLADPVGNGKTFEAGVVLSELANQNKIQSILFIVPKGKPVIDWKTVIEERFGLGIDRIVKIEGKSFDSTNFVMAKSNVKDINIVKGAYIVDHEDFVTWPIDFIKTVAFDAIVVDEAHHLCDENGEYSVAMYNLSNMMKIKQEIDKPYCLLLSATPHSGNLEKMFRLWYFVRAKGGTQYGGVPEDFLEGSQKSATYERERKFYIDTICRGSKTVAEFIDIAKADSLVGKKDVSTEYREDFFDYANIQSLDQYEALTKGEKKKLVNRYLSIRDIKDNEIPVSDPLYQKRLAINEQILNQVAGAYHDGVMRLIMIRQADDHMKAHKSFNTFFLPVKPGIIGEIPQSQRPSQGYFLNSKNMAQADFFVNLGKAIIDKNVPENLFFKKEGSFNFFRSQLEGNDENTFTNVEIIDTEKNYEKALLDKRIEAFNKLLEEKKNDKIIVFFDYEKEENLYDNEESTWNILANGIKDEFKNRIIHGAKDVQEAALNDFEQSESKVLLVEHSIYTESNNLQYCNVIVNFEVTPDPLAMDQRIGRVSRIGQKNQIEIYSYANMNELSGYCLAYFSRVGILTSSSGDATIIAGSNNENMKVIRCEECGNVELISEDEYVDRKNKNQLKCNNKSTCIKQNKDMVEINVHNFMCDKCGAKLYRHPRRGYLCFASDNRDAEIISQKGSDSRRIACNKLCCMKHCSRLQSIGCPIIEEEIQDPTSARMKCIYCPNFEECKEYHCAILEGEDYSVKQSCSKCTYTLCTPKPIDLTFDEKWNVRCPIDRCTGVIKPITPHTFGEYIRKAYEFNDDPKSFCRNFIALSKTTSEIRTILSKDQDHYR